MNLPASRTCTNAAAGREWAGKTLPPGRSALRGDWLSSPWGKRLPFCPFQQLPECPGSHGKLPTTHRASPLQPASEKGWLKAWGEGGSDLPPPPPRPRHEPPPITGDAKQQGRSEEAQRPGHPSASFGGQAGTPAFSWPLSQTLLPN